MSLASNDSHLKGLLTLLEILKPLNKASTNREIKTYYNKIVKLLSKDNCNLEEKHPQNGRTALNHCCWHGQYPLIELLIDNGANMFSKDGKGHSSLQNYISNMQYLPLELQSDENFKKIINKFAEADIRSLNSKADNSLADTLLHKLTYGSKDYNKLITVIESGADITIKNNQGFTAFLQILGYYPPLYIVEAFIKAGADPNTCTKLNNNGLHCFFQSHAVSKDIVETVKLLIEHGANVTIKNNDNETPFDIFKKIINIEPLQKKEILDIMNEAKFTQLQSKTAENDDYKFSI